MNQTDNQLWTGGVEFWTRIWQQQIEQNLRLMALWAPLVPHESASELAADAEAHKPKPPARRLAKSA